MMPAGGREAGACAGGERARGKKKRPEPNGVWLRANKVSRSALPMSVVPPEFGRFPHSTPVTEAIRRTISGPQLAGALGVSQGALHRPAPLLCWGKRLLFPVIADNEGSLSPFSPAVKGENAVFRDIFAGFVGRWGSAISLAIGWLNNHHVLFNRAQPIFSLFPRGPSFREKNWPPGPPRKAIANLIVRRLP